MTRRRIVDHLRAVLLLAAVPLLLMLALAALPVVLPFVAWTQARENRRRRRCAQRSPCLRCGVPLGEAALARADRLVRLQVARHAGEGLRMRMVRRLWACCVRCAAPHDYDAKADRFVSIAPRELGRDLADALAAEAG